MSKILFFFTAHPRLEMIFKIQMEILVQHLSKKDEVFIVTDFDSTIFKSQINYNSTKSNGYYYKTMFYNMVSTLVNKYGNIKVLPYIKDDTFNQNNVFSDIEQLKNYVYRDYNIGMCAASSIISIYRDHKLNTLKFKKRINRELKNSVAVLNTINDYHKIIQPDLIYVFNGRMATYSPIILYAKRNNLNFKVFEFTGSFDKYHLLDNEIPHNIHYRENEMFSVWNNSLHTNKEKEKIGKDFFEYQRNGISEVEDSFLGLQNINFDVNAFKEKEIITFFNSSIDEFAAVPGWENYIYLFENEVEAIIEICNYFKSDNNKQFIIRVHPNLKFLNNSQNNDLKRLNSVDNLIIIPAESAIFSYSLIDISHKIITFGSTIGIEAVYFGKPSICLGLSFYEHLDVVYIPKTKEELFSLIGNVDLKVKNKENAIIYGYWWRTFGNTFDNFVSNSIYESYFQLSKKQRSLGILLKITDINNFKRIVSLLNPHNNFFKKIKNPSYRKSIIREIAPWKEK